jgi:hypothetical protein
MEVVMTKQITLWIVYAINPERTEGKSWAFKDEEYAREIVNGWFKHGWTAYIREQTYEEIND